MPQSHIALDGGWDPKMVVLYLLTWAEPTKTIEYVRATLVCRFVELAKLCQNMKIVKTL